MQQCAKKSCKNKVVGCYSPDIDVQGMCFCEEHEDDVKYAYIALASGEERIYNKLLGYK